MHEKRKYIPADRKRGGKLSFSGHSEVADPKPERDQKTTGREIGFFRWEKGRKSAEEGGFKGR